MYKPETQEEAPVVLPYHSVEPKVPRVTTEDELHWRHVDHRSGQHVNVTQGFVVDEALYNCMVVNLVPRSVGDQMRANAVEVPTEPYEFLVQPDSEVPCLVEDLTVVDTVKATVESCELLVQPDNDVSHLIRDQREPVGAEAVPPPTMSAKPSRERTIRCR